MGSSGPGKVVRCRKSSPTPIAMLDTMRSCSTLDTLPSRPPLWSRSSQSRPSTSSASLASCYLFLIHSGPPSDSPSGSFGEPPFSIRLFRSLPRPSSSSISPSTILASSGTFTLVGSLHFLTFQSFRFPHLSACSRRHPGQFFNRSSSRLLTLSIFKSSRKDQHFPSVIRNLSSCRTHSLLRLPLSSSFSTSCILLAASGTFSSFRQFSGYL